MSALAEYSPNDMIRFLSACTGGLRLRFRPRPCAVPGPYGVWKKQDVLRLFHLLDQGSSPREASYAKAAWLQWLSSRTEVTDDIVTDVSENALASCHPAALVDIARTVRTFDDKAGFRLLIEAVGRATAAVDVRTLLRALEEPGMEAWPEYRSRLAKAVPWATSSKVDRSVLAGIAVLQSRIDWREALRTLEQLGGNERELDDTLGRIIDNVGLDSVAALHEIVAQLAEITFLREDLLDRAAHQLVGLTLDAGHTVSLEFIHQVRSPYWRMKCLRDFVSSGRIKGGVAILESAFAELERETANSTHPLSEAWLQLAAAFCAQRPRRAVDCVRKALHESSMRERDVEFAVDCIRMGDVWLRIPACFGTDLMADIGIAVRAFHFGSDPIFDRPDVKFAAYFAFAAYTYPDSPSRTRAFMPELREALGDSISFLTAGKLLVEVLKRVDDARSEGVSGRFMSEILDDVPDVHGQALADSIVEVLCETTMNAARPLAHFQIRTTALPPNSLAILEPLIVHC